MEKFFLDKFKEFANYLTEYDRKAIRRKFFSKNFRTDILPTIKFLQENAEFNKKDFSSLLIQKPKIFLMLESNNDKYKINQTLSIKEIHSFFTKEYEFDAISFKNLLLKFPQIFRMTLKEIVEILNYAKESLELDEVLF